MSLATFLRTHHEAVTAGGSIVANLLTIGALVATLCIASRQLGLARGSLDTAHASLQNNLVYTMQKDERTIAADFFGGKTTDTAPIFGQMQAVFTQRCLGSIPDSVWPVFRKDFSDIMSMPRLQRDWAPVSSNISSKEFVRYVNATIQNRGVLDCEGGRP